MSAGSYYNQQQSGPNQGHDNTYATSGGQQIPPGPGYQDTSGYPAASGYQQPPPPPPQQSYYHSGPSNQYYGYGHQDPMYPSEPPPTQYQQPYQQTYPQQPPQQYHQIQPPHGSTDQQMAPTPSVSSWGTGPVQDRGQHGDQAPPAYAHTGDTSASRDSGSTKGLADKFGKKLKLSRRSSSSSSSSSDSDGGKHKKGKYATLPPRMGHGPYPFSFLCSKDDPETISLELVPPSSSSSDDYFLVGPTQGVSHAMYRLTLKSERWKEFDIHRAPLPSLDIKKANWVARCGWEHSDEENQKLKFPWMKWEYSLCREYWGSDVDFLQGKSWMRWYKLEDQGGRMTIRCFDTSHPKMPTVASFYLSSYDEGSLEIPARIVQTLEQLDELVTLSWSAAVYHREP